MPPTLVNSDSLLSLFLTLPGRRVLTPNFDAHLRSRPEFVTAYLGLLVDFPELGYVRDVGCAPWQMFPIRLPTAAHAERLAALAAERGLEIRRNYRPSLSKWPQVELWRHCPNAEWLSERMCGLPVYCDAPASERHEIMNIVDGCLRHALAG